MIFFIVIGAVYALFVLISWAGWKMTNMYALTERTFKTRVSIIVPVRNEEKNILECLHSIAQQSYPKNLFEIIIADDGSEDQTAALVKDWIAFNHFDAKIISVTSSLKGKKQALNEGVIQATGELIVTTDADCTTTINWLKTIVSYYEEYSPEMICGIVEIKNESNFLSAFQSLEQLGLTAIGAGGIYSAQPILSSGANLAYSKKIFEAIGGYSADEAASGDDTQLMFRIAKQNPRSIHFLKSKEAIVYTSPASTLKDFISQRKRWGSKVFRQKNLASILAGLTVFIFHFSLVASIFLALIQKLHWQIPVILFALKLIPELLLLGSVISFTGKKNLWQYILPSQLIYPFYLVITALLSQGGKYAWKNRSVR